MNGEVDGISWSDAKRRQLAEQLTGFWAQDEWRMGECPLVDDSPRSTSATWPAVYRFRCLSPTLNVELKYACWRKVTSGDWSPRLPHYGLYLRHIVNWLNQTAPHAQSLLQTSHEKSALSLRSYFVRLGSRQERQHAGILVRSQRPRARRQAELCQFFFHQIYVTLQEAYDDRDEYEKDVWDLRKLGIRLNRSASRYKLDFTRLPQPWLRQAAKQFLRYNLSTHSAGDCFGKLGALTDFSQFLAHEHPFMEAAMLDRAVLLEYQGRLSSRGLAESTRRHTLAALRMFFDVCAREGWAPITARPLVYLDDMPHDPTPQPRFIPEDIMAQLNQHLNALDPQTMSMTLILQECGLRISEVCMLPVTCLLQDTEGDWFLSCYQSKLAREHSIPISREAAAVIQEQQQVARNLWGPQAHYLFPDRKGQPFKQKTFVRALNALAYRQQICDATGQLYHFTAHQFRHTVGTRMINTGVPHHIVQRYLGHESPQMTARYAHIFDQTMKEEYARFRSKVVDVTGTVLEPTSAADSSELQWMKKHILAQALPNGKCALPLVAGDCPHANACYTCVHFRTDASFLPQHKAQLEETQQLIQVASRNGWQRQKEMNVKVAANLERIIGALEDSSHDA